MTQSKVLLFAALIAASVVGVPAARPQTPQQDITRTEILKVPLSGLEGLEGIVYVADVPPGAVAARHTHPGYEFNYVLAGSILIEPEGEKPFTLTPGQATFLPRGHIHRVSNSSTVEPAKILTFLIHEIGKPLAVPAP